MKTLILNVASFFAALFVGAMLSAVDARATAPSSTACSSCSARPTTLPEALALEALR